MIAPATSPSAEALLIHLRFTKYVSDVNEILSQLLEIDDGLDEAVKIIITRLDRRDSILLQRLADLITKTGDRLLYERVKSELFQNPRDLLILCRRRFPDSEIEKKLCEFLYRDALHIGSHDWIS